MASIELGATLKVLKGERARVHGKLARLDEAIVALEGLVGTAAATNGHGGKRTLSAAGRRKIARAQRLRWTKVRQQRAGKN
jgi:hypothetical protein